MKSQLHTPVLSLMLAVPDAPAAIEWYKRALGATVLWSLGSVAGLDFVALPFQDTNESSYFLGPIYNVLIFNINLFNVEEGMNKPDRQIQPYALKAGEGWTYRFGIDFTVKASEVKDGHGAAFMEYVTRKGEEPPNHTHNTEDEMFYVLEGAITFRCGEATFDLEKGSFVFLPAGIEHGYTIHSEEPIRLIVVTAPVREGASSGWGGFVADMETGQGELITKPPRNRDSPEI